MEQHIVIDKSRKITVPDDLKRIAVQYDHNVETVTFDCPRYWDGNDLSEMTISINYHNKTNKTPGVYIAENVRIDDSDADQIHFDWTISRNVTDKKGQIFFSVCAKLVDEEGNELRHWNSEINSEMSVSEGMEGSEPVVESNPDALANFDRRITANEVKIDNLYSSIDGSRPKYTKDDIDPDFNNNSWDLIKWVAQNDDPSKYWKVGDYKMVVFGEEFGVTNLMTDKSGLKGVYGEINYTFAYFVDIDKFLGVIGHKTGTYSLTCQDDHTGTSFVLDEKNSHNIWIGSNCYEDLGIKFSDVPIVPDEWVFVVGTAEKKCPLQIIGFNHDKVADPYSYGKQKAGMTLQVGLSRHISGDLRPTLYSPKLDGVMADDGIHYKSPCRTVSEGGIYVDKRTNWKDGAFRTSLNTILARTLLEDLVVPVQKYTSQYYKSSNHYSAAMITEDRVFLLSEYEVFGEVVVAPCQEGEQYELYKDGYSKFMWSEELLSGEVSNGRLWLRSAKGADVNENTPDSVSSCSVYMSVTSLADEAGRGARVNYQPAAAASNSSPAYIAPCICL